MPEIAARAHLEAPGPADRATPWPRPACGFADLDGVAATAGPGLIGGVMVGVMTAKAIAAVHDLPFLAVNHLEGHALTARLTDEVAFPYLLLLVSGGHCQLLIVDGVGRYRRLGTTIDDALGEAFDKVAKMLGLGYPGGPAIERAAHDGDPRRFRPAAPDEGPPRLPLLVLRPEDRGQARAGGLPADRADAAGGRRSLRVVPGGGRRRAWSTGPRNAHRRVPARTVRAAVRWWSPAASPPTAICAADWPRWRMRAACGWSHRRSACAPTTAR